MELETERLHLRSIRVEDVPALTAFWTDPDVTRYMGGPRNYKEVHAELMEDARLVVKPEFDLWVVIEKITGDIVGHCGIIDKDVDGIMEFELVYVIGKSSWGKGYATEISSAIRHFAFHRFGLKRIISLIDPANPASAHVATKVGLKYEKDVVRPGGKIMRLFSLNREDV
jgi:RimJ/RimL family protein N-acetyltransferase